MAISSDLTEKEQLKFEQVKLLYAAIPLSAFATLVNALILFAVEWRVSDHTLAVIWLLGLLIGSFAGYILAIFYHRAQPEAKQVAGWETYFLLGSMFVGALWGSSAFLLFPEHAVIYQVFIAFIVGGMCAGSVTILAPLPFSIFAFLSLALGPLIVRFFMLDTEISNTMAVMLCFFLIMVAASALISYRNIIGNIKLRMRSQKQEVLLIERGSRLQVAAQRRELHESQTLVGIIEWNTDFTVRSWNAGAEEIFGFKALDAIGKHATELLLPASAHKQVDEIWRCLLNQKGGRHSINKNITQAGEDIVCEWNNTPLVQHDGEILGVYSLVCDISERRREEYYTKETAKILEMMALAVPENEIYHAICQMHELMHPNMRASILKLKGDQLFHCSAPSLPEVYSQAIDGSKIGPCAGSCGTAAFLGESVIVEDIASDPLWESFKELALPHDLRACWSEPIMGSNGNVLGTFAMYFNHPRKPSDVECKEIKGASWLVSMVMEKEHRKAMLRKLSQALEQCGESVLITDLKGSIEYVNPAFSRITGYRSDEVLGKNPSILKSGKQSEAYYKKLWHTITNGEVWYSNIIDCRKDGTQYPAIMSVAPIFDDAGQISHYVSIQQDMTDHKVLEEKFYQAQKMEALGMLVGGIAHDFNNMLAGMTGNLYLAKADIEDRPEVLQRLELVEKLSFRAADMIKQLLAFARKDIVKMKPFGLKSLIQQISKLSESTIPENINFYCDFCREELVVKGDVTQLQQVLMNLLSNACDAVANTTNPAIFLSVDAFEPDDQFLASHFEYVETEACLFAHIVVKDNGCGISDADKERIFEPFYTTKEVGVGTGLGLAMSDGAIKSHEGILEVESTQGEGSSFHIYLPLLKEKHMSDELEAFDEIVLGKGELILVVDDNATVREVSKKVLERLAYRVLEASDGLQAVELFALHQHDIALVLMDIVMPRLGGVQACERIKAICSDAKIIFTTGYDKDKSLKNDMPSNKHVILPKPYNIMKLSQAIRRQLETDVTHLTKH